ncbi:MAG TPA: hypothetical protein VEX68_28020 [Bryobacteraceae bacterium]|nr:hypothetical protein [Bryobacteraceae bacterium]
MVVTAADESVPPPFDPYFGVFIVYGKTNQTYMVLEISSMGPRGFGPKLESPTKNNVYVHWYGDYGMYSLSHKYEYDLVSRTRGTKSEYKKFQVKRTANDGERLAFSGPYGTSDENLSLHRVGTGQWVIGSVDHPEPAPGSDGRQLEVSAKGIAVVDRKGRKQFSPVPIPSRELYKKLRPEVRVISYAADSLPGSIENEIGPYAFDGERVWFANTFYDGEGMSGVGAIGSFDVTTRKYEMRYLPEIARWSASALRLESGNLWIGIMRRPEGAEYGTGVLRFDTKTGATRTFPIKDYVVSIERLGDALYFGTSHSVYAIDLATDAVSHIRVEPGRSGKPEVFNRQVLETPESGPRAGASEQRSTTSTRLH